MRSVIYKVILLVLLITTSSSAELIIPHPQVEKQGFQEKLYIAYFGSTWCDSCVKTKPMMYKLRKEGWKVYIFDVDIHKEALKKLLGGKRNVPRIVIMHKGKIVETIKKIPILKDIINRLKSIKQTIDYELF